MKIIQKTRQPLMYILAVGVILFGTVALVFLAQGYSYDFKTGQIRNSGLILLDSHPGGATISFDGKPISNKTPYRYDNAPLGEMRIDLRKDGYRAWNTKQSVVAGEVTFVEYPLLLPDVLVRQSVSQPVPFTAISVSDDSKKAIAQASASDLYTLNENGVATKIYSAGNARIESAIISPDGARGLVRQINSDGSINQVLVQTNGGAAINLTQEYKEIFPDLRFSSQNSAELFWLENTNLRKIDTARHSLSTALAINVLAYTLSKDRIIVSSPGFLPNLTNNITSMNLAGGDKHDITALPVDPQGYSGIVIHSRFHTYMALRSNSAPFTLYSLNEPDNQNSVPVKLATGVTLFGASPNQKFLSFLSSDSIHSIDLETARNYEHTIDTKGVNIMQWYDDFHIILHDGQYASLIDFDGYNRTTIVANSVFGFLFPNNSKSILYLNQSSALEKVFLEQKE